MAKARTYPIEKIDPSKTTKLLSDRMMMRLIVSLDRYVYLMNEFKSFTKRKTFTLNDDFVEEFYDYYALKASPDFKKDAVKKAYFNILHSDNVTKSAEQIANDLCTATGIKNKHISFASKLIHTVNDSEPIFDSRICEYLAAIYGTKKTMAGIEGWYSSKDPDIQKDQNEMIEWFRKQTELKKFSKVSNTKIIDSMIYVWHKYK